MLLSVSCKALLVKDGKILLLRLGAKGGSTAMVGSFDLPGGRMMAGETFADVLQREVWEETGIDLGHDSTKDIIPAALRVPVYVDDLRLPGGEGLGKQYEATQYVRLFFKIDCAELNVKTLPLTIGYEHDDYVWVAPADAPELILFPGIKDALTEIAK